VQGNSTKYNLEIALDMKVLLLIKEPFIDRIPNLKSLLIFLSNEGDTIKIITTKSKIFPEPTFLNDNIKYYAIKERESILGIPTYLKLYLYSFLTILFTKKTTQIILAGQSGLIFGNIMKWVLQKKYIGFVVEFPKIPFTKQDKISLVDILEHEGIRNATYIITHDNIHQELITKALKLDQPKFLLLPNGTLGEPSIGKTRFLHERLKIAPDYKILLHPGGFGEHFDSFKLINQTENLPNKHLLVFHVSHNILNDPSNKAVLDSYKTRNNLLFSTVPVSTNELDELYKSAYIGIAWYNTDILGFRAKYLGLSAGKIGNFLKCGIPVIAPSFDSLNYISNFKCGIQIQELNEIFNAILQIESNYELFASNALDCYNKLWKVESYCHNIRQTLIKT
jgi:hypothetical protein